MNPYEKFNGKLVEVKFVDFKRERTEVGVLSTDGYNYMVKVGSWVVGIDNIVSVVEVNGETKTGV